MKKFIVLAALLLVTGCTANNNSAQKPMTPKQTGVETRSLTATPPTTLTQASSIATTSAGNISIKQAPNTASNWWDWFNSGQQSAVKPPGTATTPTATQAPTQPQPPSSEKPEEQAAKPTQFEQQVLDLVNKERAKVGLKSLTINSKLSNMAMVKAQDMYNNNYFDHNSPRYGSPFDMMKEFGITYSSAGENIAKGQSSAAQVMNDWMNSPGHKANILKSSFTEIGIGYYNQEWVQEFIG